MTASAEPEASTTNCFLLQPEPLVRVALVRWRFDPLAWATGRQRSCTGPHGYHRATAIAGVEEAVWELPGGGDRLVGELPDFALGDWSLVDETGSVSKRDPRWPTCCDACGAYFGEQDAAQVVGHLLYRRSDRPTELVTLDEAGPGATYFAWWMNELGLPPQLGEHPWYVKLPNGLEWSPDSRALNCARPRDRTHHCWIARGSPPYVTVDKDGDTCAAGTGSISSGEPGTAGHWRGYLFAGKLVRG